MPFRVTVWTRINLLPTGWRTASRWWTSRTSADARNYPRSSPGKNCRTWGPLPVSVQILPTWIVFFFIDIFHQFGQRRLDYWIFEFKFDFFFVRFIIISISKSWLYFSTDSILANILGIWIFESVKIYGTREIFTYRTVSEFFVPFFFSVL